jgi:hypothetical protein
MIYLNYIYENLLYDINSGMIANIIQRKATTKITSEELEKANYTSY